VRFPSIKQRLVWIPLIKQRRVWNSWDYLILPYFGWSHYTPAKSSWKTIHKSLILRVERSEIRPTPITPALRRTP
jgi:hypothetical protein